MKTIVITGGSGFIGTGIIQVLLDRGYQVINIDRVPSRILDKRITNHVVDVIHDDLDPTWFDGVYGVINLMGASIFGRWTSEYQNSIATSRITATERLVTAMKKSTVRPTVLVSASAIGYYGDRNNRGEVVDESADQGTDFLAQVCGDWERVAQSMQSASTRVVIVRTGHVIGKGGLVGVLAGLFRYWIGGYFTTGFQGMPWIDWRDVVDWYVYAIEHATVSGVYNTATGSVTQKELMQILQKKYHQPVLWKIPLCAVRMIYKGFADTLATGVFVSHDKLMSTGFTPQFTSLEQSISDAIQK